MLPALASALRHYCRAVPLSSSLLAGIRPHVFDPPRSCGRASRRDAADRHACACLAGLARNRRPAHRGDGPGRGRHASHRFRALHHRMAADHGGDPAALGRRLAKGVRGLSEDPGIFGAEAGHEPRRVQGHLLVGMGASLPWPPDRRRLPRAVCRLLERGFHSPRLSAPAARPVRAWRAAGRRRLVHGEERPRHARRREPIPARRASRRRRADPGLHALAVLRSRRGRREAGGDHGSGPQRGLPPACSR